MLCSGQDIGQHSYIHLSLSTYSVTIWKYFNDTQIHVNPFLDQTDMYIKGH